MPCARPWRSRRRGGRERARRRQRRRPARDRLPDRRPRRCRVRDRARGGGPLVAASPAARAADAREHLPAVSGEKHEPPSRGPRGDASKANGFGRRLSLLASAPRLKRRRRESHARRLPQGAAVLLPLPDRLLRRRRVPDRHRLFLHLQRVPDRHGHDDRDLQEHEHPAGHAAADRLDAPVLGRVQRAHHRAADDAPAQGLGDRGRESTSAR